MENNDKRSIDGGVAQPSKRPKVETLSKSYDTHMKVMDFEEGVKFVREIVSHNIPRDLVERLVLHFLFSGKYEENIVMDELVNVCVSGVDIEAWLKSNDSHKNDSSFSSSDSDTSSETKSETKSDTKSNTKSDTKNDNVAEVHLSEFFWEPEKQCAICLTEYMVSEMYTVNCLSCHRFCFSCFKYHTEAKVKEGKLVNCPAEKCDYVLQLSDMKEIKIGKEIYEKYENLLLNNALQTLHAIGCPTRNCGNYVVPSALGEREMCECSKCKAVFCSLCQRKYHYRTTCEEVDTLEKTWMWWCETGREEYWRKKGSAEAQHKQQLQTYLKAKGAHDKELRELQKRIREEEEDERWKAENCRYCPKCGRTINKMEGCNSMKCGTDFHGGNAQNGCGHSFTWTKAKMYKPRVTNRNTPSLSVNSPESISAIDNGPYTCEICDKTIKGLRFSCVNCNMYDVCEECEATGICIHNNHSFKIVNLEVST